jgi:hypothetical protein
MKLKFFMVAACTKLPGTRTLAYFSPPSVREKASFDELRPGNIDVGVKTFDVGFVFIVFGLQ